MSKPNRKVICCDCGCEIEVTYDTYRTSKNKFTNQWRCKSCLSKYRSKLMKKIESEKSEERRNEINAKRSKSMKLAWSKIDDEERKRRASMKSEYLKSLSDEERANWTGKISNTLKSYYENESEEDKIIRSKNHKDSWKDKSPEEIAEMNKKREIKRNEKTQEELDAIRKKLSATHNSMSKEEKDRINKKRLESLMNKSDEEKSIIREKKRNSWKNKSPEEIQLSIEKRKQTIAAWPESKQREHNQHYSDIWYRKPIEERINITKNHLSKAYGQNKFHQKFEKMFNESILVNDYYIKEEFCLRNETDFHHWDYGIFDKLTNTLQMVVDLDGKFFHGDECDYDGLHSKEEYDEKRSLTVPENVKIFIINEINFTNAFQEMIKCLIKNYDEYINDLFKEYRSMPFPYPEYSDKDLIKSWNKLKNMNTTDKYHQDISLNTRFGDRLINHFHHSIYSAHVKNKPSPYEAWYDDELMMRVIKNRIIYQNHLNPNKILQGFNISKVATKVSVFSAGRAIMLIAKYLSEYTEVFDPFSGFSGRMLGTISLGKTYIGQDISPIHVRESNEILSFLQYYGIDINCHVDERDILESNGKYQCLFTCPPYSDKEQWLDVPVTNRTCDDWIDECLNRFDCKRYLFVVDNTKKYKNYIVDEIHNKSHLNDNFEYVIMIKK